MSGVARQRLLGREAVELRRGVDVDRGALASVLARRCGDDCRRDARSCRRRGRGFRQAARPANGPGRRGPARHGLALARAALVARSDRAGRGTSRAASSRAQKPRAAELPPRAAWRRAVDDAPAAAAPEPSLRRAAGAARAGRAPGSAGLRARRPPSTPCPASPPDPRRARLPIPQWRGERLDEGLELLLKPPDRAPTPPGPSTPRKASPFVPGPLMRCSPQLSTLARRRRRRAGRQREGAARTHRRAVCDSWFGSRTFLAAFCPPRAAPPPPPPARCGAAAATPDYWWRPLLSIGTPRAANSPATCSGVVMAVRRRRGGCWYGAATGSGGAGRFEVVARKMTSEVWRIFACSVWRGDRGRHVGSPSWDRYRPVRRRRGRKRFVEGDGREPPSSSWEPYYFIRGGPSRRATNISASPLNASVSLDRIGRRLELYRSLGRLTKRLCGVID